MTISHVYTVAASPPNFSPSSRISHIHFIPFSHLVHIYTVWLYIAFDSAKKRMKQSLAKRTDLQWKEDILMLILLTFSCRLFLFLDRFYCNLFVKIFRLHIACGCLMFSVDQQQNLPIQTQNTTGNKRVTVILWHVCKNIFDV